VDHIGIDLHKRESQICIETEDGEVIEKRIRTERDRSIAVFGERPRGGAPTSRDIEAGRLGDRLVSQVVQSRPRPASILAHYPAGPARHESTRGNRRRRGHSPGRMLGQREH
jgi:hypothetical protein